MSQCYSRFLLPLIVVGLAWTPLLAAELRLSGIFSDHMVLQRGQSVTVWGWAQGDQPVTVEFAGQSVSAVSDDRGEWQAALSPMSAIHQGQKLTVVCGDEAVTINDVLVGDVWHASGQSNMAMNVDAVAARIEAVKQHIADADLPAIRFRQVQGSASKEPLADLPAGSGWVVGSPQTVPSFSAVAFYFARRLREALDVPIGIIDSSRGGTPIEPYIPRQAFQSHPTLQREWELGEQGDLQGIWELPGGVRARDDNWLPARLFHSRLAPITKFSTKGVVWYQGESNCGVGEDPHDYQYKMRALISGWRTAFDNDAMPFYFVQLPGSGAGPGWPYLREQQRLSGGLPHTGMVVTIDLLDADIHPPNKVDVGQRLARLALADAYGHDVVPSGPIFRKAEFDGAMATVQFDQCEEGLVVAVKQGLKSPQPQRGTELHHFELADADGNWHPADAHIEGRTVRVRCDSIDRAVAVRYAYEVNPQHCYLYNSAGLPASPFCSSDDLLKYDPGIPPVPVGMTKQIDRLIAQKWQQDGVQPAQPCSDREFVRRVYLDLGGRIPTIRETHQFLADDRPDRRARLIDHLLDSEDFVQHFSDVFDTLLMGRGKEKKYEQRKRHGWRAYLERVFREGRPWDQVSREILLARPQNEAQRGAAWFLYERNDEYQQIAEAIAPAFFGVRIECAQCHDHMMALEIKQEHYWGLVAFYNRGKNQDTKNGPRVVESAVGGFSEFANIYGDSSPNRLSFLDAETVPEPRPGKDDEQADSAELYAGSEVDGEPRVPKFSRREQFVEQIVSGHPLLAPAMVNRLWALLLGRGIVHPYDEMDSMHDPSHPELLNVLAQDFSANGFDIRRIVRAITNSEAYQLSSLRADGADDPATFAWYLERPLTAEQLTRSIQFVLRGEIDSDASLLPDLRKQLPDVLPDESVVTVSDALFLTNNQQLQEYLDASVEANHLIPRLIELSSHRERASLLFQTAYGRAPEESESAAICAYLDHRSDALEPALGQVIWALLMSAEFRFNH